MPLWDFNYTAGALSAEQRKAIAERVTRIYSRVGMPEFYVQVRFHEAEADSLFVGGQNYSSTTDNSEKFAAIQIYHVARSFESQRQKEAFLREVDEVLNPVFQDKGWNWEYWVTECPRELWKVNGMVPPPTGSITERKWKEANKPLPEALKDSKL